MRFLVRQKYFTVRDKFYIEDANGAPRYMVKGKLISFSKKFSVCAPNEREIYFIKQRLFRLFPTFDILSNGQEVARYRGKLSFFTKRAKLTSPFGDYKIAGSPWAWDFQVKANGAPVMSISKKILRIADTYTVDINNADEPLMLSVAIIIDAIYHKKR